MTDVLRWRNMIFAGCLLLCPALLLCSCGTVGGWLHGRFDDGGSRTDAVLEQLLEAAEGGDSGGVAELFSKRALDEADGFDQQVSGLFAFFQGTVESWESTGRIGFSSTEDGEKEQKTASFYDITTSESDYVFVLIYCSEKTADPDSVGLYALRVVSKEKEDDYLEDVEDMEIPGICIPETAP